MCSNIEMNHSRDSNKEQKIVNRIGWRTNKDLDKRQKVILHIIKILHKRKPDATEKCLEKIPQMAKRLEELLYRTAPNKDIYETLHNDRVLKKRLQQVAVDVMKKNDIKESRSSCKCQKKSQQLPILKSLRRRKIDKTILSKVDE